MRGLRASQPRVSDLMCTAPWLEDRAMDRVLGFTYA